METTVAIVSILLGRAGWMDQKQGQAMGREAGERQAPEL